MEVDRNNEEWGHYAIQGNNPGIVYDRIIPENPDRNKYWLTKQNDLLVLKEMEYSHLVNIRNFVENKARVKHNAMRSQVFGAVEIINKASPREAKKLQKLVKQVSKFKLEDFVCEGLMVSYKAVSREVKRRERLVFK